MTAPPFDVVVPTIGRPQLSTLLHALDAGVGPRPQRLVVVDDRRGAPPELALPGLRTVRPVVVRSGGRGPAAARNAGWRRCCGPWIAFLDDDVVPGTGWLEALASDLARWQHDADVVAGTGAVRVPLPADRRPTDAERGTRNLERAAWITADFAVRRTALVAIGGFDERFPRAYREDTDLALRLLDRGGRIVEGRRAVLHPPAPDSWRTSVRAQRGNADDALMRRLHGADWRVRGRAPAGTLRQHQVTVVTAGGAAGAALLRHRGVAAGVAAVAAVRIARSWWHRARRGPADRAEWGRLAVSSLLIPFAATWWSAWGRARAWALAPRGPADRWTGGPPTLVLFDRDGTLVHDVPYNGDPNAVVPVADARPTLDRLRSAGVAVGVVSNQSGVARGLLTMDDVSAVNGRVAALLGPFVTVAVCPHDAGAGCTCRKPAPGMVLAAARQLGVPPHRCAVVGDIGSDVDAALAAGARGVLVPTGATRTDEIAAAPEVVTSLSAAADLLLGDAHGAVPTSEAIR